MPDANVTGTPARCVDAYGSEHHDALTRWYLAQWALVELLGDARLSHLVGDGPAHGLVRRLAQDPHASVRTEARWRLREGQPRACSHTPGPSPSQTMAGPSFFKLKLNVGNFLAVSGTRDYDRMLIERVTAYLRDHRITLGYHSEVYWSAFTAWTAAGATRP